MSFVKEKMIGWSDMTKEILFIGKRVDNGEWVVGDLIHRQIWKRSLTIIRVSDDGFDHYEEYEVIPETVGQFTGLTDKNGNKIFEGDIISATALDTGGEQRAVVCFGNFIDGNNDDEYIGFFIEFDSIKTTITQLSMEECKNRIEVIGNIYDNKELLEND